MIFTARSQVATTPVRAGRFQDQQDLLAAPPPPPAVDRSHLFLFFTKRNHAGRALLSLASSIHHAAVRRFFPAGPCLPIVHSRCRTAFCVWLHCVMGVWVVPVGGVNSQVHAF